MIEQRRVTLVGVGALGSHFVQMIRNAAITLHVVDFDRVSAANVHAQFHARSHVGRLKADALKQTMSFLFGADMRATSHRLTHDNVEQLLRDSDLVVDAVDNGATRRLIQEFTRVRSIPCLHGALAAAGQFGRVVWSERFAVDDEPPGGAATCEDGAFLDMIAITAAYLTRAATQFVRTGRRLSFHITPTGTMMI